MTESESPRDEIGLLDLLVVIAEAWWVIVAGGLVAGAIAYAVTASQPPVFVSQAVVAAPPAKVEPFLANDPTYLANAQNFDLTERDNTTAITYRDRTADAAGETLSAVVTALADQLILQRRTPLDARITALSGRQAELNALLAQIELFVSEWQSRPDADEIAVANVLELYSQLQAERFGLREEARGLSERSALLPETIFVMPPGPAAEKSGRSPALMAFVAAISVAFLLLLLAFIRQGLRHAATEPDGAAKIQRIKHGLLLRPAKPRSGR